MLRLQARPPLAPRRVERVRGRRILLLDPHAASRDISALLLRYFGYEVQTASTLHEGLHLARSHRPTAVVSDLGIAGAGAATLMEELRRDPALGRVPVFVVGPLDRTEDGRRAVTAGAACFLPRPLDANVLRAVLAAGLGEPLAAA